jgi:hypothetical protein
MDPRLAQPSDIDQVAQQLRADGLAGFIAQLSLSQYQEAAARLVEGNSSSASRHLYVVGNPSGKVGFFATRPPSLRLTNSPATAVELWMVSVFEHCRGHGEGRALVDLALRYMSRDKQPLQCIAYCFAESVAMRHMLLLAGFVVANTDADGTSSFTLNWAHVAGKPIEIKSTVYFNSDVPEDTASKAVILLAGAIERYSDGRFTLTAEVLPEGPDHVTAKEERLGNDTSAVGIHSPLHKPLGVFTSSINFSSTLEYKQRTAQFGMLLLGVGGAHDCCIHASRALSTDTLIHEFLHTLQGQYINAEVMPSVDDNWWYEYPGFEGDEKNGWEGWYRALLSGGWGDRQPSERPH